MIPQSDKEKLKKLGLDLDAIIVAHNDPAEKTITIPDGEIYTAAQLETRDDNTKKEGAKDGKKEAEKSALTTAVAEINKYTGLNIDPTKIDRFGDIGKTLKEKLAEGADDKVKNLTQQVTDLLADKATLTGERDTAKGIADKTKFEYDQFKHLPDNRAKLMNESEYLAVLSTRGVEVKPDGVYRNGEPMKDTVTKAPLPHKEAYKQLFEEFSWIAQPPAGAAGGRGGGNSGSAGAAGGGRARTFTEAQDMWLADNPNGNIASAECDTFISTQTKDNPTFDYNA